jgi:hypothetical protein
MPVNFIKSLICGAIVATSTVSALANEGELVNVTVRSIGAIGTGFGSHLAGNFEVTLDSPYNMPASLNCNSVYITTKRANDPDRLIFTMLREAKELKLKVGLRLSDEPALQAFPGRCSIIAAGYPAQ